MDANEYTDGVWAGQNPGSGSFSGESYSQWKFYDDTNLGQSGCNEKECSSGEGKYLFSFSSDTIIGFNENGNAIETN